RSWARTTCAGSRTRAVAARREGESNAGPAEPFAQTPVRERSLAMETIGGPSIDGVSAPQGVAGVSQGERSGGVNSAFRFGRRVTILSFHYSAVISST